MDATTPKIQNITPITSRIITESDTVVSVVDKYGNIRAIDVLNSAVHDGTSFVYTEAQSIASGSSGYFLGKVGSITAHLMGFFIKSNAAPLLIELYESPTISSDGTQRVAIARNRQSTISALMSVFLNPTVTSAGTLLLSDKIFGDKQTVSADYLAGEWVLKKNTNYLFKLSNTSNQSIDVVAGFNWAEYDHG